MSLWVPTLICGFCMQNSDFWSRITTIYVSQLPSVVFAYTTAHFGPELQVCTGPRLHLWLWAHMTACLIQEYKHYMCSSPRLWFCACKTATLALELLVSTGPRPHLCFCMQNSAFWTRITNLYGSQTSPVVLCMQYSVISTWITCLYGSQPLSVVFALKTAPFGLE